MKKILLAIAILAATAVPYQQVAAQEVYPADNGIYTYHTAPRYRESESHPFRVVGYILHPIGWVLREAIFRPLSYFASSTPTRKSVMGYREPYDYRGTECFDADKGVPNCRAMAPFNSMFTDSDRDSNRDAVSKLDTDPLSADRKIFFSDVNFDFDRKALNQTGKEQAAELYRVLLQSDESIQVYLEGHTDNVGSETYNYKLGTNRAQAVKAELVKLGISERRLSTVSFGETRPMASNDTAEGRAQNRRVETRLE